MPDNTDEQKPLTERERVEDWREQVLFHAGYPPDTAIELARRSDIDLHHACELLTRGCTIDQALAILR